MLGPLLVALLLLLAACGDDDADDGTADAGDTPEAQPAPDTDEMAEGTFDALPLPPRADPIGTRTEMDDVVARSFSVRGTTPAEVLDYYTTALDGWELVETVDVGTALRADYERDGRGLRVTAQPSPTIDPGGTEGNEPVVELSLQLGPPATVFAG